MRIIRAGAAARQTNSDLQEHHAVRFWARGQWPRDPAAGRILAVTSLLRGRN
jgi:hypothetical protein